MDGIIKTISEILRDIQEDVCDDYCKYRDTVDEDALCELLRNGGTCPLDRLN